MPTHHSKADADEASVPSGLPPLQSGTKLRPLCSTGGRTSSSPPGSLSCLLATTVGSSSSKSPVQSATIPSPFPPPYHSPLHSISPSPATPPRHRPHPNFPYSSPPHSPQLGTRPPTETKLSRLGAEIIACCLDTYLHRQVVTVHPPEDPPRYHAHAHAHAAHVAAAAASLGKEDRKPGVGNDGEKERVW